MDEDHHSITTKDSSPGELGRLKSVLLWSPASALPESVRGSSEDHHQVDRAQRQEGISWPTPRFDSRSNIINIMIVVTETEVTAT